MSRAQWSLERVVAEIRALHAGGELATTSVLMETGHRDLVSAAGRYAGGWRAALQLAGAIELSKRRTWTKESVVAEIRDLHRRGVSVVSNVPNAVKLAARKLFGSWPRAREQALPGFSGGNKRWTKRMVLATIRELHERGVKLTADVLRGGSHASLTSAAIRAFGSWEQARRAAVPDHASRRTWTPATVKATLRIRQREGKSLNAAAVYRDDASFLHAARKHFGRWRHALEAAGVSTAGRREAWSPALVKERLRDVADRHGRITAVLAGPRLVAASQRYFGSFHDACVAADVVP